MRVDHQERDADTDQDQDQLPDRVDAEPVPSGLTVIRIVERAVQLGRRHGARAGQRELRSRGLRLRLRLGLRLRLRLVLHLNRFNRETLGRTGRLPEFGFHPETALFWIGHRRCLQTARTALRCRLVRCPTVPPMALSRKSVQLVCYASSVSFSSSGRGGTRHDRSSSSAAIEQRDRADESTDRRRQINATRRRAAGSASSQIETAPKKPANSAPTIDEAFASTTYRTATSGSTGIVPGRGRSAPWSRAPRRTPGPRDRP